MRPLKLEVEGFTAFRTPTCLDLEDLDLFAITGPTGAGKSSLIDAISYALYGSVPRVTDEISSCISQGLDRMRVTLEFRTGEERYRVFRETRRKGAGNVRLDLERGPDDWRMLAEGARDVTARVTQIIGLDYNGFTRSVLLPQGQFQEFLAGSADKRRAVLRSLLSFDIYDRMRARASNLATGLDGRIRGLEHELEGLSDATPENKDRLELELAQHRSAAQRLAAESESFAEGVERATLLARAVAQVTAVREAVTIAASELEKTKALAAGGEAGLQSLRTQLEAVELRLAGNCFDPDRFNDLTLSRERAVALQRCLEEMAKAEAQHQQAGSQLVALMTTAGAAEKRHSVSESELEAAKQAQRDAELHDLAAALQVGLKPGDPCPVCGGVVGEMAPVAANGLQAAQKRFEQARQAEAEAKQAALAATAAAARAESAVDAASQSAVRLAANRDELAAALSEVLPDDVEPSTAAIVAALNQQLEARKQRQALEAEARTMAAKLERITSETAVAREQLAACEQRLGVLTVERTKAESERTEAETCLLTLSAQQGWTDVAQLVKAGKDATLGLKTRLAGTQAEHQQTQQAIGKGEERLARLKDDIERAQALHKQHKDLRKEHGVAADLAFMLQANKFQDFVQAEALQSLAEDGSRRLEGLSSGRYRLKVEDKGRDFEVEDQWNAGQTRSVKTLSGGETFLASLALALALAESLPTLAASRRVVLDSIFLDEGFGSLDADALDLAAEALEALRVENRMVCIVTHLPDLAQRLPARVEVTKAETGSSVAVS